ncbi:uncharacterized protein LOC144014646 [Festucalex cinctus]
MTFHRTMTTTMHLHRRSGYSLVMDKTRDLDSLSSSKECEDRAHSNVRPLFLRQRKLGPKVTLLTVSRTKIPKILAGMKWAGSQPSSPLLQNQDQGMLHQS